MQFQRLSLLLPVVLAAGCATHYAAPTTGPTAKLRIISAKPNNNVITFGNRQECLVNDAPLVATLGVNANSLTSAGAGKKVGVPLADDQLPKQTTEVLVPASQPLTVQGSAVSVGAFIPPFHFTYIFCKSGVHFVPKEGSSYEVRFEQDGPTACSATLAAIEPDGSSFRRIGQQPLGSPTATCGK